MSIDQIIKLVFDSGGTLGLAIFTIFFLNKVWDGRLTDSKEHAAAYKALADQVLLALKENTVVSVQLLERLRPDNGRRSSDYLPTTPAPGAN